MKHRLILFLLCLFAPFAGLAQPYVIDRFDVRLDLARDGELKVQETITVTFNTARRGIFRFIPVNYEAGRGLARNIYLDQISVTDASGTSQTTKITKEGPNIKIRIGDEKVWLQPGTSKIYVIRYRVLGAINWFAAGGDWGQERAELYWNVTGNEWDTAIRQASCDVRFPATEPDADVRARAFVGTYGSSLNQTIFGLNKQATDDATSTSMRLDDGDLTVARTAPLPAGEGLTVVLAVPANTIEKPTFFQSAVMFLIPNIGFGIPILVLFAMTILWFKYGRDPHGGPMVVQFEPPDGLSGSAVGVMADERVDQRDIAAGFISLAVKGYLRIYPTEVGMIIKRRVAELELTDKPAGPDLTIFEQKLYNLLKKVNGRIDESDLRTYVAPSLSDLQTSLYQELMHKGYYRANPRDVRGWWGCGGVSVCILLAVLSAILTPVSSPLAAWTGGIAGAVLVLLFARGMPRRTPMGSQVRARVLGFEEFIRRARGKELEWQDKRQPDMSLFEEYLPHAVAFGLTTQWAQAFDGILHEMPGWYVSPYGSGYNWMYFSHDLTSINSSIASAAATPPRSSGSSGGGSGFGGGGFSGGGFGGGGGGSW
ncbi:MAG: DUF2207 domain-containing protein [Fimbriimonadaceae bacterium]|nr:DUF2207 domain-containing protein [Fimbriimonadaceae bacterium]